MPLSMVHRILRNIYNFFPFKITHVQELLSADLPIIQMFNIEFLVCTDMDNGCPWNTLWTEEAHFHLQGHGLRIVEYAQQNIRLHIHEGVPLTKITV